MPPPEVVVEGGRSVKLHGGGPSAAAVADPLQGQPREPRSAADAAKAAAAAPLQRQPREPRSAADAAAAAAAATAAGARACNGDGLKRARVTRLWMRCAAAALVLFWRRSHRWSGIWGKMSARVQG